LTKIEENLETKEIMGGREGGGEGGRAHTWGLGIGDIKIVQGDVLDDLLLLVHVALGHGHVFFCLWGGREGRREGGKEGRREGGREGGRNGTCLQIKFCSERVRASYSHDGCWPQYQ